MIYKHTDLVRCKQLIEEKLDWGASIIWTSADFENLQQRILDETGVSLSASTLRRIWGRVDYQHKPSGTTLNTLAQFAGYPDWRQFVRAQLTSPELSNPVETVLTKPYKQLINWQSISWFGGAVVISAFVGIVAFEQKNTQVNTVQYSFSSKPLTRTIPNSVIFTYDASASPTDSVYIQQSWDKTRRDVVARDGHTHTSIYYEPGFYRAKLIIGNQVVKEHALLIPTTGWLGTIGKKPVPIYLKPTEFINQGLLRLPIATIRQKNVPLQPEIPLITYYNVGNFAPVPVADFSFSCAIKNEYSEGAAACQVSWIALITNDMPITIPLSAKGCISDLALMNGTRTVSGKNSDLSGLGVDFTSWVHVTCHSDTQKLYYTINDKVVYSAALPAKKLDILGILYGFQGTGSVKNVTLRTGKKTVFHDF